RNTHATSYLELHSSPDARASGVAIPSRPRAREDDMDGTERINTVIVGGGQAGLSVGYHLARAGIPFVILDASTRIGDAWRSRWDSLRLFTPARYDGLQGMRFPAPGGSFPSKNAIEVARKHKTLMAGRETGHVPFRIETPIARGLLIRIVRFVGQHVLTVRTPIGRKLRPTMLPKASPLIRVKPKDLTAAGIERVGRVAGVRDGRPLLDDGRVLDVANVIWCTGYQPGFSWIDLPVFGEDGEPMHERGIVSSEPGLYF